MPLSQLPLGRRSFLSACLAGACGVQARWIRAEEEVAGRWALLADTHIWEQTGELVRDVCMARNLEQVVAECLAAQPDHALIAGDCAYLDGQAGDYAALAERTRPLIEAGIGVHHALGNHDHRLRFREALAGASAEQPLESKQVTVIDARPARWVILDTLDETNVTPGRLGEEQLAWLPSVLDALADRPLVLVGHHNLNYPLIPPKGIADTEEFLQLLASRPHVQAYIHGHTHHWNVHEYQGLHVVNLPPTAYVFSAGEPQGWVEAEVGEEGLSLTLHTLDKSHLASEQHIELAWREVPA